LRKLLPEELDYLASADTVEQRYLLWLAICRHYRFVGDFAVNVVREKFGSLGFPVALYAN
jgi:hypothetical protein